MDGWMKGEGGGRDGKKERESKGGRERGKDSVRGKRIVVFACMCSFYIPGDRICVSNIAKHETIFYSNESC